MGLILKDKIIYKLSQEYSKCGQAVLITAYLTSGIFDILGNLDGAPDRKIQLFVRGNKQDFLNGSVCMKTLRRLHNTNIQCFLLQNLHAKLYIFDEQTMFIGSANLTNNGLSVSPNSNIEILHQCQYSQDIQEQVKSMLHGAIPLTEELLSAISVELQEMPNKEAFESNQDWLCLPPPCLNNTTELSMVHLPLCNLDYLTDFLGSKEFYHDQYLFGLRNDGTVDIDLLQASILHRFLIERLINEPEGFIRFGTLRNIISEQCNLQHSPELTELIQNIYSYYKHNPNLEIQYSQPNYTEVLSLQKQ